MVRLKLVSSRPKKNYKATRAQRNHQEIAWIIYIAEGYLANLKHVEFFATELTGKQKAALNLAIKEQTRQVRFLRSYL